MAQLVEQRIRNAQVVGSSPTSSSMKKALALSSAFFNEIRLTASEISCGYEAKLDISETELCAITF